LNGQIQATTMTPPDRDVAQADQVRAAAREAASSDVTGWLHPEGASSSISIGVGDGSAPVVGPVTLAFTTWLKQAPHPAGCELAAGSPRPLFGFVESAHAFCASCFDLVLPGYLASQSDRCSVCKYLADDLSPTTMRLGVFTVLALVCLECEQAEHRAAVASQYSTIAGHSPDLGRGKRRDHR
jgi:hypothetical protein